MPLVHKVLDKVSLASLKSALWSNPVTSCFPLDIHNSFPSNNAHPNPDFPAMAPRQANGFFINMIRTPNHSQSDFVLSMGCYAFNLELRICRLLPIEPTIIFMFID